MTTDQNLPPRAPCIYIDADACPQAIRSIIIKTAERTGLRAVFVANHAIGVRSGGLIEQVQVGHGFDVADNWIVDQCRALDTRSETVRKWYPKWYRESSKEAGTGSA